VKFQTGQECGGAYLKLLTADDDLDLVRWDKLWSFLKGSNWFSEDTYCMLLFSAV